MELQATLVSRPAARILERGEPFAVKAVFHRVVNLESAAGVIALQTGRTALTPLTVQTDDETLRDIARHPRGRELTLTVRGGRTLCCRMEASPRPLTAEWHSRAEDMAALLANRESLAFSGTRRHRRLPERPTAVQQRAREILEEAETFLDGGRGSEAARLLEGLAGLGPGLTPAGDDFLLGVLAVCRCWPEEAISKLLLPPLTVEATAGLDRRSWLSRELLRWGLEGEFAPSIGDILHAGDSAALAGAIAAGVAWGHTSGSDTLGGILWATEQILYNIYRGGAII